MEIRITDKTKSGRGWVKLSVAAKYCNVSVKVFRTWMQNHGLPFSRLPSGHTLVSLDDVDVWLKKRRVTRKLSDELLADF